MLAVAGAVVALPDVGALAGKENNELVGLLGDGEKGGTHHEHDGEAAHGRDGGDVAVTNGGDGGDDEVVGVGEGEARGV